LVRVRGSRFFGIRELLTHLHQDSSSLDSSHLGSSSLLNPGKEVREEGKVMRFLRIPPLLLIRGIGN
jgi:hypothetical protein